MTSILLSLLIGCEPADGGSVSLDDSGTTADADTDSDSDTDTDTDTDSDSDCDLPIQFVDPGNSTVSVSTLVTPTVWFLDATAEAASDVAITLNDGSSDVAGTLGLVNGGAGVEFLPNDELLRSTQYTWSVETCSDSMANISFTTVDDPISTELEGNVYVVDLNSVTWTSPSATVGALIIGQIDTKYILVKVQSADSAEVDLVGATAWDLGSGVAQYPCVEAIDFDAADFAGNPAFQAGPVTTTMSAAGYDIEIHDFELSGAFADDAGSIDNLRVRGYLDLGNLDVGGTPACDYLAFAGETCKACPDDGDVACVLLDVTDSEAPLTDTALDENLDPADHEAECN